MEKSQGTNPATKKLQFYPDDVYVDGIDNHPRETFHFILDGLFQGFRHCVNRHAVFDDNVDVNINTVAGSCYFDSFAAGVFLQKFRKAVRKATRYHLDNPIAFHGGMRSHLGNRKVGNGYFTISVVRVY